MTPWNAACQASVSFIISHSLLKFMSIVSVMPSNHLILFGPLLLLPSIFPRIRFFFVVLFFESAMVVQGAMYGVKESEIQKKKETSASQEQITFNKVRRGSSQISELLH